MLFRDQLNRKIHLPHVPQRIISLVPSITELVVDLGLEAQLVGVTKFCVHPPPIRKTKTVVGGTKKLRLENIRALQPDLVLCNKEENTKEMVDELSLIAPVHLSDIVSLESALEIIEMYGEIFEGSKQAKTLISKIEIERQSFLANRSKRAPQKVAYFIWKEPWMVAADDTFINTMLNEAGFRNVFSSEPRYPEIHLQDPRLQQVDAIFLSSEPYPFKEVHVENLKAQFPGKVVRLVDGEMFSWYGSRLLKAYGYFSDI